MTSLNPDNRDKLQQRVVQAAEAALADHLYVSAIDVLTGVRLLAESNLQAWRKGRVDRLERVIQGNLKKLSLAMSFFRQWAVGKGLKPSETAYVRRTRSGTEDLQFSLSGDPAIEKNYRTHYVSPLLSEQRQHKIAEKLSRAPELLVYDILRDSECSECGVEVPRGSFLFMEAGQPLCLECAGLNALEYLPSGDAALTRRATKYSGRTAIVVRFSRSRGHYERQGILVETSAIEKAELECVTDAGERARARALDAERRKERDRVLIDQMAERIQALFPRVPPGEARSIAAHTAVRGSGRVGRTEAGRKLEEQPLAAAVTAAVRHRHTNYDELLARGVERAFAREQVGEAVRAILVKWRE